MSNVFYTMDIYAFSPFYRVSYYNYATNPPTTCQKILFHAFGAILYVCLHMLSSLLIYISTQSFNFAITVGLLYLGVSIVRHSKLGDGIYIVDVETGVDPTAHQDDGHNGYDIVPRSTGSESEITESETEKEGSETSCEGESVSPPSTDPDTREDTEETPPETEESGNESPLKED